jgi:hypothetical protein
MKEKKCANHKCNCFISWVTKSGRKIRPSEFKKRKYCSVRCATKESWESRPRYLPRIEKPDQYLLNRAFSKFRNYTDVAKLFNVSRWTIARWMGRKKDLLNPPKKSQPKD